MTYEPGEKVRTALWEWTVLDALPGGELLLVVPAAPVDQGLFSRPIAQGVHALRVDAIQSSE